MFRGRLWQAGQEVGVAVRTSFAILEYVVERGKELEPPLDSGIMVFKFFFDLQCLMVGECAKRGSPIIPSEALESPNDAVGL